MKKIINKAILIGADDWEGLFVNGELVEEGHTLNEGYSRIKYFVGLAKKHGFNLEEMEECHVTETYAKYLENAGGFHKSLKYVGFE